MPAFSRFTAFGHLRFSSRPSNAELIYRDMVKNLGGERNVSTDPNSLAMARVYANAMLFARALNTVQRAGAQFRPLKALELLPALEHEYGIIPHPADTILERQQTLAAIMRIPRGASRANVEATLRELLGAHFIKYITVDKADIQTNTNAPATRGVYSRPGTPRSVFRLLTPVTELNQPSRTYAYAPVLGARPVLMPGDRVIIDAGSHARCEAVSIVSTAQGFFEATFARPHNPGVLIATGRHPYHVTSKRHNLIVLSREAATNGKLRQKANNALRRLLRGVSTWSIVDYQGGGAVGPFTVGTGELGLTPIGEIQL